MSRFPIHELIDGLERAAARIALVVRGIDDRLLGEEFGSSGTSPVFLETFLAESDEAIADWLGAVPETFCCERTARAMAMTAYQRACQRPSACDQAAVEQRPPLVGVACIARFGGDTTDREPAQVHLACQTASTTAAVSLVLASNPATPRRQEQIAVELLLVAMAEACRVDLCIEPELHKEETIVRRRSKAPRHWEELLHGKIDRVMANDPDMLGEPEKEALIFPGAFDPLHGGHRRMAEIAGELLDRSVAFELSIENVDKPPLDFIEIADRAAQFTAGEPLWLTRAATFVEKASVFPGATLVVGADTIARVANPRYYGDDAHALRQAIDAIRAANCRFLVFGRRRGTTFQTLADLRLPNSLEEICRGVSAERFRDDISSTVLRRGGKG